ncbi:GroES-like protein [Hyaloscypha variabilis F]|uniref:GroES-like protein n=1 Tax=Hyaloscypha variabilis (strain UAMH 11265 / GT02V1 / F) TaxID=1149755 RepID=A0A2J6QU57_HYAVF|nr:GroES-like protein [Hyaloscypha variabilis F]
MKEVIVHPTPELHTTIHEVPVPEPGPDEVVIKVIVAGSNPKDWIHLTSTNRSLNSGDDIAGIVHSFGSNVEKTHEFRIGDRVAAFHPMMTPHGAFAEYAVSPQHTVLKIPDGISFEEAATIPLVTTTAAITLFRRQYLPTPWAPRSSTSPPLPLIIYGASSALGTFAIKLARASNIHPIIAISGSSSSHLTPLLDELKGDALVDYRVGVEQMKAAVKEKLNGLEAHHALDAISGKGTWIPVSQMLSPSTELETTYLSVVSGANKYDEADIGKGVEVVYTYSGTVHAGAYLPGMPKHRNVEEVKSDPEFGYLLFRYLGRMLAVGRFSGHPFVVVPGGLDGVGAGLNLLKTGQARGNKFVFKIGEE